MIICLVYYILHESFIKEDSIDIYIIYRYYEAGFTNNEMIKEIKYK
jgi:hypothetical protein